MIVLGGGVEWIALETTAPNGQILAADYRKINVTQSRPTSPNTWTATIRNTENATSPATVTAYAICAP